MRRTCAKQKNSFNTCNNDTERTSTHSIFSEGDLRQLENSSPEQFTGPPYVREGGKNNHDLRKGELMQRGYFKYNN